MIISRAPSRITLGGGATDLASYYSKHGGFLIASTINKYCTILATKRFYPDIRLSYSRQEVVSSVDDIEHRLFRAALEYLKIENGIELHSTADVPANCGLGMSSSFTVSLLYALHAYSNNKPPSPRELAEEACHLEIDILSEPIGKQDQYMAAFGGIKCLTFEKNGNVQVEPLRISHKTRELLESNLLLFYTGKERQASDILREQDVGCKADNKAIIQNLDQVKDIGLQTKRYLEMGKVDVFGELLNAHWEIKKKRSGNMSDPFINECYDYALKNGASGGKLIGAGGGGFLMFYCTNKAKLIKAMSKIGLPLELFSFVDDGAEIILNI